MINDFFRFKRNFDIQDFKDLQNNNYNLKAAEMLPYIFETMDTSDLTREEQDILNIIKDWDFNNDIDKLGPSIWDSWWKNYILLTWDEFDVEDIALDRSIYLSNHLYVKK